MDLEIIRGQKFSLSYLSSIQGFCRDKVNEIFVIN
jgi:hypothetical protein